MKKSIDRKEEHNYLKKEKITKEKFRLSISFDKVQSYLMIIITM
jgi:hypothetical protein